MNADSTIDTCLFCAHRPVLHANFVPKPNERIMFGATKTPYQVIRYGLCEGHCETETAASIRRRLHLLKEAGDRE